MSKINEGEVLTKLTGMLNDSYMRGYQDALNTKLTKQPKLSIPKKIAEELDGFNPNECETKIELLIVGYYKSFLSDELMSFCLANNGLNLCAFYLAGKALGVELVEVTDE
ncbi:hypothetical protein [Lactococcus formosensis]|uniref:Phage protein n=1 Tax=Lactococcus formosensis TaxID=1281486 RepID=A0A9X4NWQ4_9LACT|nr:hypothetical protein [Lactococcus formosensis]MDG6126432.1 hypothetical protein [Lactococcus formosensis]MDG6131880.1 hypothetical protein [Lactococcus formosensis]MDG6133877.1 hypothetical protein [Lactococcus formosensis]MDG6140497.1 hypothetical protein [Lactococcus formosensis]MDG6145039.1 hypothetical protein [Lactococcus formosensis]